MNPKRKIIMVSTLLGLALAAASTLTVHPMSPPARNEQRVISLFMGARARVEGCCVSAVHLQNGVVLLPDKPAKVVGYIFTLRSAGSGFGLEAVPEQYAITGWRCFFVDQSGVIRSEWQKHATSNSPSIQDPQH